MARISEAATPTRLASFDEWSQTRLDYHREVYKGDYYRIVHGQEEHYSMLRNGWQDEAVTGAKPWSASPEAIAAAEKSVAEMNARKAREAAAKTPQVTRDLVAEMIEKSLAEKRGQ